MNKLSFARLVIGVITCGCTADLPAGDWPQILGPNRNGQAIDEQAIQPWSESGPPEKWSFDLGTGYAGPAVVGGRVIVFHRVGGQERVEAIDAETGESIWQTDFPALYRGGVNPDTGPRCVPLVDNDRVYVYGAAGNLHCVELADGKEVWSRDAYAEYDAEEGYFGAGSTPIIADNKLLVNVGGRDAGLVAFDLLDGSTVWQVTSEGASYSSPAMATIAGRRQVFFVTRMNAVSVLPESGEVLFRFPFGRRGPTVNAATPLIFDNHLFVSSSYGVGAKLAKLDGGEPKTVWENNKSMSSQYTTCVYHEGYLYGTHGREDFADGELRCLDAMTGERKWRSRGFGVANTILVGDQLLILTVDGKLYLAQASPESFQPVAESKVSSRTTRALPALSNGKFYFRDTRLSGGKLRCLQL